jgi:integrase
MSQISTPPEIKSAAQAHQESIIPVESKEQYLAEFDRLLKFRRERYGDDADKRDPTEADVKAYIQDMFHERGGRNTQKGLAPKSISKYVSCLKKMMNAKYGWSEDLVLWKNAESRVADAMKGRKPNSASALPLDDVEKWLTPKRENKEFVAQVAVSIAVTCGLRVSELQALKNEDVYFDAKTHDLVIIVHKRKTQKTEPTSFRVESNLRGPLSPITYVEQYARLKADSKIESVNNPKSPYFVQVRDGKIHNQVVGYNSFAEYVKLVAHDLDLDGFYTTHDGNRRRRGDAQQPTSHARRLAIGERRRQLHQEVGHGQASCDATAAHVARQAEDGSDHSHLAAGVSVAADDPDQLPSSSPTSRCRRRRRCQQQHCRAAAQHNHHSSAASGS